MFNVGKLSDGYRLLQTLVNQSAIERKRVEIDEEEVLPPEVKLTSLNSILDDDNGVESVKFHGAISEQIELKKMLGKRSRRAPKLESIEIPTRQIRPRYSADDTLNDDIREKLTSSFLESCQMMEDPSPSAILNVYKSVLQKIQVPKLCRTSTQVDAQESHLCKLVTDIEPTVWF